MRLNRDFPGRPAILQRLVIVFEQLRDVGKAAAFLKAYARAVPHDAWANKRKQTVCCTRISMNGSVSDVEMMASRSLIDTAVFSTFHRF